MHRDAQSGREDVAVEDRLVVTLRTDSYDCPRCGVIVVATDDNVIDLERCHQCR